MPNSMENGLVDEEAREALELSKDDLVEMLEAGEPATLASEAPQKRRAVRVFISVHSSDPSLDQMLHSTNDGEGAVPGPSQRVREGNVVLA